MTCVSTTRALPLAGQLHEERDEREVGEVRLRRIAAQVVAVEADAVVGIDDDERLVPETDRAQAVDEAADELVRVADLQEVPLPRLRR